MGDISIFFSCVRRVFDVSITLFGFTFTFWQLFIVAALIGVVGGFIHNLLDM